MRVLIIEDDNEIASYISELIAQNLGPQNQYGFTIYNSVKAAINDNAVAKHDLVLLDLLLKEGESGIDLVRHVRASSKRTPIIVVSSLNSVDYKVSLLKAGADDYITKPFNDRELLARIDAVTRRDINMQHVDEEKHGDISFYWKQNKVLREGKEIMCTEKEMSLLSILVINKNNVVRKEDILKKVWNASPIYHSNVVESTVRRLRKKVDNDFSRTLIENIHGVGYRINL